MLRKPKQVEGFHEIVDFLKSSHIAYALTVNPTIYVEHLRQFWTNASIQTVNGNQVIQSRVCDKPITITEACIRTHLRLDDASRITTLSKEDLFQETGRMGYEGPTEVYKFFKSKFSPQWRFFVHTLQHCLSRKTTGWSEFSSTIAYALVCLSTSKKFNFSQMILNDLLSNLDTKTKTKRFYMYPRFVQEVLNQELTDLPSFEEVYVPKPPKGKVFSNMKSPSKDFSGKDTPLFSTMIGVSHSHGEASGSQPTSDQPTDDLPTPFISNDPPQIPVVKTTSPITQTYVRKKVQKVPSLPVSSPQKPESPLMEHYPLENIQRKSTGVSPNRKKVLSKEKDEHVGSKAHTTDSIQGVGQDSVNITKTFPTKTLDEQSSKGPRCQETKGVVGASARQKASTKRSKDPSRVLNTPKGGEDRYNYDELMETIGNVNLDVLKQGSEIKELKKLIISQQSQVDKLKKLVLKLVHKKKRNQFILKNKRSGHDASKKGENQEAESEIENEAETEKEAEIVKAAETEKEVETVEAAVTNEPEVETAKAVETEKSVAETGMSIEEIEIAETLVKAKNDTLKATQKAKGVVIKEGVLEKKKKEVSMSEAKNKGKEKMVEPVKSLKKRKQIDLDAELAKELNIQFEKELEKENEIQKAKDRKIALDLAKRLNDEYQKSLKLAAKRVTMKVSKKRQPSKTFLPTQERRKMINFLKGSVGVPEGMFTKMSFGRIEGDGQASRRLQSEVKKALLQKKRKKSLYGDLFQGAGMRVTKMAMEYLCMMFDPDRVKYLIKDLHHSNGFKSIDHWMLFERCGVYVITIDKSFHEYYLVDKVYDRNKAKLQGMQKASLVCNKGSEMAVIMDWLLKAKEKEIEDNYGLDAEDQL
ncbi:hypothetical protein L6452_28064 [Arctium lappa]|uniref:Uncharacterized protein n=1 Tax=Arctium lappa TaxID=4217 RepID=A0ACB8ZWH1_ARCLA|nr:hypothetical protein L6452_28064 [Arctium lappa]